MQISESTWAELVALAKAGSDELAPRILAGRYGGGVRRGHARAGTTDFGREGRGCPCQRRQGRKATQGGEVVSELADHLRTYISEKLAEDIAVLRRRDTESCSASATYDGEFGYRAYALELVREELADLLGTWDTTRPTTAAEILHGRRRAAVIAHASPSRVYDVPSRSWTPARHGTARRAAGTAPWSALVCCRAWRSGRTIAAWRRSDSASGARRQGRIAP